MMERLTRRIGTKHEADCAYCTQRRTPDSKGCFIDCELWSKQTEKLAAYEDAEEQGLLLRLPCAIGGTIYKFEYPTIYDENGDGWTIIDKKRATVAPLKFSLCHLDSIGKLYYLTREEADKALAEMQKG